MIAVTVKFNGHQIVGTFNVDATFNDDANELFDDLQMWCDDHCTMDSSDDDGVYTAWVGDVLKATYEWIGEDEAGNHNDMIFGK